MHWHIYIYIYKTQMGIVSSLFNSSKENVAREVARYFWSSAAV